MLALRRNGGGKIAAIYRLKLMIHTQNKVHIMCVTIADFYFVIYFITLERANKLHFFFVYLLFAFGKTSDGNEYNMPGVCYLFYYCCFVVLRYLARITDLAKVVLPLEWPIFAKLNITILLGRTVQMRVFILAGLHNNILLDRVEIFVRI